SDDGYVNLTRDSGASWTNISNSLPQNLWVSRVVASQYQKDRVFVALNGYRNDDFKPYLFVSENNGKTWKSINNKLPLSPINVIREDTEDENILYVGTDEGAYISFDKGENWQEFSNGLPKVAVHDLVIQEEAKDLVIGTHGRSIYKTNVAFLQQYNTIKNKEIAIFEIPSIRFSKRWGSSWNKWVKPNEPSISIPYYVLNSGKYTIEILAEDGTKLNSFNDEAVKGFNYFEYDVSVLEKTVKKYFSKKDILVKIAKNEKYYLPKGTYIIKVSSGKNSAEQNFDIE
ncbi:MAG: hypothetical protein JKY00_02860, partial [Roseicyclus sp.]|nr:hypothetical protein [Roseicyclus sp.]